MHKYRFAIFGLVMLFGCFFFLAPSSLSSSTASNYHSLRIMNRQFRDHIPPVAFTLTHQDDPDVRLLLKGAISPSPKHFLRKPSISSTTTAMIAQTGCTIKVPSAGINTIGAALNRARSSCTIEVDAQRGPFRESLLFVDFDNFKIVSTNGSAVIQGNQQEPIFVIENRRNVTIQGFTLTNALSTIFIADSSGVMIRNNKIQRSTTTGILTFASAVEISGNEVTDTIKDGNSQFGWGIDLEENTTGTLRDNSVLRSAGTGVFVRDSRATLDGNQISDSQEDGIFLSNSQDSLLKGNVIRNNVRTGVVSFGSTLQLSDNQVLETRTTSDGRFGEGVVLEENTTATLTNNTFSQNAGHGLSVFNSKVTIKDNTISQNVESGVFLSGSSNAEVGGNILRQNGTGISLIQGSNNVVEENEIVDNEGIGIRMDDSVGNTLIGNAVAGNDGPGLSIFRGESGRQRVSDNLFLDNAKGGINIFKSSGEFSGNLILQNGDEGVRSEAASPALSGNLIALNEESGVLAIDSTFLLNKNIITANQEKGIARFSTSEMLTLAGDNAVWRNGTGDYLLITPPGTEQSLRLALLLDQTVVPVLDVLIPLKQRLNSGERIQAKEIITQVLALVDVVRSQAPEQLPAMPVTFSFSNNEGQLVDGLKLVLSTPVTVDVHKPFTQLTGEGTTQILLNGGRVSPETLIDIQLQSVDPLERIIVSRWHWMVEGQALEETVTLPGLFPSLIEFRMHLEHDVGIDVLQDIAFRNSPLPISPEEVNILENSIIEMQALKEDLNRILPGESEALLILELNRKIDTYIDLLQRFLEKFASHAEMIRLQTNGNQEKLSISSNNPIADVQFQLQAQVTNNDAQIETEALDLKLDGVLPLVQTITQTVTQFDDSISEEDCERVKLEWDRRVEEFKAVQATCSELKRQYEIAKDKFELLDKELKDKQQELADARTEAGKILDDLEKAKQAMRDFFARHIFVDGISTESAPGLDNQIGLCGPDVNVNFDNSNLAINTLENFFRENFDTFDGLRQDCKNALEKEQEIIKKIEQLESDIAAFQSKVDKARREMDNARNQWEECKDNTNRLKIEAEKLKNDYEICLAELVLFLELEEQLREGTSAAGNAEDLLTLADDTLQIAEETREGLSGDCKAADQKLEEAQDLEDQARILLDKSKEQLSKAGGVDRNKESVEEAKASAEEARMLAKQAAERADEARQEAKRCKTNEMVSEKRRQKKAERNKELLNLIDELNLGDLSDEVKEWKRTGLWDFLPDIVEVPIGTLLEDLANVTIPIGTIDAIRGLYDIAAAALNPCVKEGMLQTERRLRDRGFSYEEAMRLREELCELLQKMKRLLDAENQ